MRKLYYVPFIHSLVEFGADQKGGMEKLMGKLGSVVQDKISKVLSTWTDRTWELIDREFEARGFYRPEQASQLLLFEDSILLPKPGDPMLQEVLFGGQMIGARMDITRKLVTAGATLCGTEDAEEIDLQHALFMTSLKDLNQVQRAELDELTNQAIRARDRMIAVRIIQQVPDPGQAILMMGLQHDVPRHLSEIDPNFVVDLILAKLETN